MSPNNRRPTHPGEVLLEEFLIPMSMTQVELAEKLGVSIQRINTIINGKRAVSAETAILLARAFKNSPHFWMNLQISCDLYDAQLRLNKAA